MPVPITARSYSEKKTLLSVSLLPVNREADIKRDVLEGPIM